LCAVVICVIYDKNQVKNHKNQFNWNLYNRKKTQWKYAKCAKKLSF